jgi:tRNA threonylcarbamoyladenosine biosynthesis protein TsaB
VSCLHRDVPRRHNQLVLGMIDELMTQAMLAPRELDAVAFGCGPGSFTGVRIAAGIVQAISFVAAIPAVPVSTLAILAETAFDRHPELDVVCAVLRSRPGEIYLGGYARRGASCTVVAADAVLRVDDLTRPQWLEGRCGIVGDAAELFDGALLPDGCIRDPTLTPHGWALLRLARVALGRHDGVAAEQALPVYLEGTRPWRKLTE